MESRKICAIVQDLLPSYVDKLTKPETTSFVDAHMTDCETCRRICRAMAGDMPPAAIEAEAVVHRLQQKRRRKLALGWGIVAVILLVSAICLLPLPRRINVTHEGVIWRCGGGAEEQSTGVTITGIYHDYLFRQDYFAGSLRVEALPQTHGDMSVVNMGEGQSHIWYEDEEALMKSLGSLYVRKDSSVMMLLHEDGYWDAETGLMLTAPASTREEAVALANELAGELSPNWLGTWTFE